MNEQELEEQIASWEKVLPPLRSQAAEQTRKLAEACATAIAAWAPAAIRAEAERHHASHLREMGKAAIQNLKREITAFGSSSLELVRTATSSGIDGLRPSTSGIRDPIRAAACEGVARLMKEHGFAVDPKARLAHEFEWSDDLVAALEAARESARIVSASEQKLTEAREALEAAKIHAIWDAA
ncbi:hypothetical protein BH09MYX1_BH09MYX1_33480 [soil metagenome]